MLCMREALLWKHADYRHEVRGCVKLQRYLYEEACVLKRPFTSESAKSRVDLALIHTVNMMSTVED